MSEKQAFTIAEWCARWGLCRASFYNLDRRGEAPRSIKVGTRRLITISAEREWAERREAASNKEAA